MEVPTDSVVGAKVVSWEEDEGEDVEAVVDTMASVVSGADVDGFGWTMQFPKLQMSMYPAVPGAVSAHWL